MLQVILNKLGVPVILFVAGLLIGGLVVNKYKDNTVLLKLQNEKIQSLVLTNESLQKVNKALNFNIENSSKSISQLDSKLSVMDLQKREVQYQYEKVKNNLNSCKFNEQLLFVLQNAEQSNGLSSLPNAASEINDKGAALKFADAGEVVEAIKQDLFKCNGYILQLNALIDNIESNANYYNGER